MSELEPRWRTVSQVVFPDETNDDALALYLDFGRQVGATPEEPGVVKKKQPKTEAELKGHVVEFEGGDAVTGRRSLKIPASKRVSLGTYFNGFPASYWRRWTDVRTVRLSVTVSGHTDVLVYKSSARGVISRVGTEISREGTRTVTFDLPLDNFGDGGWYWFELVGHNDEARLEQAEWQVAEEPLRPGTLSIGITTLNRTDFCTRLIQSIAAAKELRDVLDVVYVVDQGSQPVEQEPGWTEVAAEMGAQLRLIKQANLGGSGGFARGMYETATAGLSDYHMMLDDDVEIEPEAIVRALTFATYCRKPTLVGGHMFDLFNRSVLHSYGEGIDRWKWWWGPLAGVEIGHDLAKSNLRATPWLHRRMDVDYNGWWMTLVPVEVIKEIGTSLPVFIKWDDAEFGVRAGRHGFPTVSMPGVCVWHISWNDKDDTVDWQAYYHERNRVLVALMYSPYKHGGGVVRDSFAGGTRHSLSMQYYAQELRNEALRDLLRGPDHLHATIGTKLGELRSKVWDYVDAQYESHPEAYPPAGMAKPPRKGKTPTKPGKKKAPLWLLSTGIKQLRPVHEGSEDRPEVVLSHANSKWWMLAKYDSAVVTKADGSGAAFYRRRPELMRELMLENLRLHAELRRNWDTLAKQYRDALPEFTSLEAWKATFGLVDEDSA